MAKSKLRLNDPFINNYPAPETRHEVYDDHVNGLALRVTPTGHKSFVFRYRYGDKVKRYTIGTYPAVSLAKAREDAKSLSYKVTNGIDPLAEKKKAKEPKEEFTFKELSELFIKRHLPELRKKTRDEYDRLIKKEINPVIGTTPAKEVRRKQIIDLLDKLAIDDDKPVLSNRVRAVLSSIFTFGIDKDIVESNPVLTVKKKKKTKNGERVEKRRKRVYTPDELKKLWAAFSVQSEPVRTLFILLLLCGQRLGETRRSKWTYINFKKKTWTIPAELTKAKRDNVVPLSAQAIDILKSLKKSAGKSEYIFPSRYDDDKPIEWLQNAVERVQTLSGVKDFRIHDLRRSAATYMAELGTERTVLGKILNHKELAGDDQVTAIYDRHDYLDQKREALQKWANQLERMLNDDKGKILKMGS